MGVCRPGGVRKHRVQNNTWRKPQAVALQFHEKTDVTSKMTFGCLASLRKRNLTVKVWERKPKDLHETRKRCPIGDARCKY